MHDICFRKLSYLIFMKKLKTVNSDPAENIRSISSTQPGKCQVWMFNPTWGKSVLFVNPTKEYQVYSIQFREFQVQLFNQTCIISGLYSTQPRDYYRVSQKTWEFSDEFDIAFVIH